MSLAKRVDTFLHSYLLKNLNIYRQCLLTYRDTLTTITRHSTTCSEHKDKILNEDSLEARNLVLYRKGLLSKTASEICCTNYEMQVLILDGQ